MEGSSQTVLELGALGTTADNQQSSLRLSERIIPHIHPDSQSGRNEEAIRFSFDHRCCMPLQLKGKQNRTSSISSWRVSCTISLRRSKLPKAKKCQRSFAVSIVAGAETVIVIPHPLRRVNFS